MADNDPTVRNGEVIEIETQLNNYASRIMKPLQEGEYVIMKDDPTGIGADVLPCYVPFLYLENFENRYQV